MTGIATLFVAAALAAIVVGLVVGTARLRMRRAGRVSEPGAGRLVGAAIVVGWIFAIGTTLFTVYASIGIISGGWPVPVLTQPFWPTPPHPEDIGGVHLVTGGGYTEAHVSISDLPVDVRVWNVVAVVLAGAGLVVAAVVVIRLCRSLRAGRGLSGAAREFGILSITALVCGFGWDIANQIAGILAAQLVAPSGLGESLGISWPVPASTLYIQFWPVLPFLAFGALAAAFRYAEQLQRDTEGLV